MAYAKTKDKSVTFRTYPKTVEELNSLANRVDRKKWEFNYDSKIRECTSVSGIAHHVLSGNLTIQDIENELEKVEGEA